KNLGLTIDRIGHTESGTLDPASLGIDKKTAALVVQSPNFFGCVEDLSALAEAAHDAGALLVVAITEPMSLGVLKPPGACGADIVAGGPRACGVALSFAA